MDQPANAMNADQLDLRTPDFVNENFAKLAALFPHCVTETAEGKAIDFDLLRQELPPAVAEAPERAPTSPAPASISQPPRWRIAMPAHQPRAAPSPQRGQRGADGRGGAAGAAPAKACWRDFFEAFFGSVGQLFYLGA
jgi:hypothetical protein